MKGTGEIISKEIRRSMKKYYMPSRYAENLMYGQRGQTAKGIPLKMTNGGKFRYPLFTMERGQFFFVPNMGRNTERTSNSVTSSVNHCRRATGRQFAQRRYPFGVKVWRIF